MHEEPPGENPGIPKLQRPDESQMIPTRKVTAAVGIWAIGVSLAFGFWRLGFFARVEFAGAGR
jgi:hypothetical protein